MSRSFCPADIYGLLCLHYMHLMQHLRPSSGYVVLRFHLNMSLWHLCTSYNSIEQFPVSLSPNLITIIKTFTVNCTWRCKATGRAHTKKCTANYTNATATATASCGSPLHTNWTEWLYETRCILAKHKETVKCECYARRSSRQIDRE